MEGWLILRVYVQAQLAHVIGVGRAGDILNQPGENPMELTGDYIAPTLFKDTFAVRGIQGCADLHDIRRLKVRIEQQSFFNFCR